MVWWSVATKSGTAALVVRVVHWIFSTLNFKCLIQIRHLGVPTLHVKQALHTNELTDAPLVEVNTVTVPVNLLISGKEEITF